MALGRRSKRLRPKTLASSMVWGASWAKADKGKLASAILIIKTIVMIFFIQLKPLLL